MKLKTLLEDCDWLHAHVLEGYNGFDELATFFDGLGISPHKTIFGSEAFVLFYGDRVMKVGIGPCLQFPYKGIIQPLAQMEFGDLSYEEFPVANPIKSRKAAVKMAAYLFVKYDLLIWDIATRNVGVLVESDGLNKAGDVVLIDYGAILETDDEDVVFVEETRKELQDLVRHYDPRSVRIAPRFRVFC